MFDMSGDAEFNKAVASDPAVMEITAHYLEEAYAFFDPALFALGERGQELLARRAAARLRAGIAFRKKQRSQQEGNSNA